MKHLWTEGIKMPEFKKLRGDIKTDVLVIGGGLAGVLCAKFLHDAGVDYVLAEAKKLGDGITKGTTAVLSAQHDTLYKDLVSSFGFDKAKQYLDANLWAVEQFRLMSEKIPCDFEEKPSFMYSKTETDAKMLEQEVKTVKRLGFAAEFETESMLPFKIAGIARYPKMAQFHPLKFIAGTAQGLNIYDNTFVHSIKGSTAFTDKGKIEAKKIIVATHFPFINRCGLYFMRLYQMRSFIIAIENAPDLHGTYVDTANGGIYFRNYKNLLLVGGADHRTGKKIEGFSTVRAFIKQYFPDANERYVWAAQDCMSLDGVPYIGQYASLMPKVYVATGFNEWGMTTSMVSARILTDLVKGEKTEFSPVFGTCRSILRKQLFVNLGDTLVNFLTPSTKRCSHMGCSLKWNKDERSWDCVCHGSRFDEHGKLIDNPAMRDSRVE